MPDSGRTSAVHHRIALFDSSYRITQIISQTDIMRALHSSKDQIRDCLKVRLLDIPGAPAPRVSVCQMDLRVACRCHGTRAGAAVRQFTSECAGRCRTRGAVAVMPQQSSAVPVGVLCRARG